MTVSRAGRLLQQVRQHFYSDAVEAMQAAIVAGRTRLRLRCIVPELNVETDGERGGGVVLRHVNCDMA